MRLHPRAILLLPQLKLIEQKAKLTPMASTLATRKLSGLVGLQLMECLKSNTHRDPVVVMRHTTPSKVASNKLNLHFRANFGLKNVGKVAKLVRPTAYKLVEVNELRNFSLLGR